MAEINSAHRANKGAAWEAKNPRPRTALQKIRVMDKCTMSYGGAKMTVPANDDGTCPDGSKPAGGSPTFDYKAQNEAINKMAAQDRRKGVSYSPPPAALPNALNGGAASSGPACTGFDQTRAILTGGSLPSYCVDG